MNFLRPYLATIKDSFREALASRVLWIMLILVSVLLLSIAPLGIRHELTWRLGDDDVLDVRQLATQLLGAAAGPSPSPGKHIWQELGAELQGQLKQAAQSDLDNQSLRRVQRELTEALNDRLAGDDFFDRDAWQGVGIVDEARDLLARGPDKLSQNELARRNRLLLEAAFPDLIRLSGQTSVRMLYLFWDFTPPMPVTEEQLDAGMNMALSGFMEFFVGIIAVFVAILVTAAIIPNTLEPGSIELLLSKPISRTLLFLSKFAGGCAFILVIAAYLIGGLWLLAGWRLGLWNHRLLLCIPIFLFLFAVYYSVSALAGVIWRSAIVSVIVTILFWATCFTIGLSKGIMEQLVLQPNRIMRILPAGDSLVSVNEAGQAKLWDTDTNQWEDIFQSAEVSQTPRRPFGPMPRIELGPVYDARRDQLIAVGTRSVGGRGFGMGASLWVASRSRQFKRVEGAEVPGDTIDLFQDPSGALVRVSPRGLHRLAGDPESRRSGVSLLGVELPIPVGAGPFAPAGPDPPLAVLPPSATAMNAETGELAILTRGHLAVLAPGDDGIYRRVVERELEDADRPSTIGFGGRTILVAHHDGTVRVIGVRDLVETQKTQPEGNAAVRFVEASPAGTWFALVFHNGQMHLYDQQQQQFVRRRISGQGDISAATFTDEQTLLVAECTTRVTAYDLAGNQRLTRWAPTMNFLERGYRYGLLPLYTVYPKPGELDNTVHYLLTNRDTIGPTPSDMRQAQVQLNPWAPVWSSGLFMIVVLAAACIYLWRADL